MSNQASDSSPTRERSTVRNTLGKGKSQGEEEPRMDPLPHEAIREFCDKHYDQLLSLMAEKVHKEKMEQVKTRLNFDDEEQRDQRSREEPRNSVSKSSGSKRAKKRRKASPSARSSPSEYSCSQSVFSRLSGRDTRNEGRRKGERPVLAPGPALPSTLAPKVFFQD
ncbi:hypothetical protein CTI12_AA139490 [Artemisia annua]|uniref:Uncharacterized protein n=1 Tax=Artemisia annua TaxID=35608 RepID=A0A2U1PKB0_ARTAN|nr:hypothetical protein CTI12_AA139490 [Artemisia annua]